MKITFLGGVEGVTGSCYQLDVDGNSYLVDCGLNYEKPLFKQEAFFSSYLISKELKGVFLTHAHLDHCGLLPMLCKLGFYGPIYCTEETREIALINLQDFLKTQNNKYREGKVKQKIFSQTDYDVCKKRFKVISSDSIEEIENLKFSFKPVGHILGACGILFKDAKKSLFFTGDLGKSRDLLDVNPIESVVCDYLVCESTYGNKVHSPECPFEEIESIAVQTLNQSGKLIIPAFSIGRTQKVIKVLNQVWSKNKKLQKFKIYIDGPMGRKITEIYKKYSDFKYDPDFFSQIEFSSQREALVKKTEPYVLLTSSGMMNGGPILYYLPYLLTDENNQLLLVGYQAEGTLGRRLLTENVVEVDGVELTCKVGQSKLYSSHMDQPELIKFVLGSKPKAIYLVHGELEAKQVLGELLLEKGQNFHLPKLLETLNLI